MLFSLSKTKAFGIAIGILLIILLFLGWQYRAEVRKSASLLANNIQLSDTLKNNRQALQELEAEKERLEVSLERRAMEQERIETQAREKIVSLQREIEGLRGQYEEVDIFLSVVIPDAYAQWMRGRSTSGSGNTDSQGETPDEPVIPGG